MKPIKPNFAKPVCTAQQTASAVNALIGASGAFNLLDNSNFTNCVNQREKTEYTAEGYTIDRWKIFSGASVIVNDHSVSVSGYMRQYIPDLEAGKTLTFAYGNENSAFIGTVGYDSENSWYYVDVPEGSWKWAAVYEGSYSLETLPTYKPKGYVVELLTCMRYYQFLRSHIPQLTANSSRRMYGLNIPIRMRLVPTVNIVKATEYDATVSTVGATFTSNLVSESFIRLIATATLASTEGAFASVEIEASADL